MEMIKFLCAGLWWYGLWYLLTAVVTGHYSHHYHYGFQRLGRWCRQSVDLWGVFPLNKLVEMVASIIPVNPLTQVRLERQLTKAAPWTLPEFIWQKSMSFSVWEVWWLWFAICSSGILVF